MDIIKKECTVCKALHPDTLFPSDDGVCVYCKAEEAERLEPPDSNKSLVEEEQEKLSQADERIARIGRCFCLYHTAEREDCSTS